MVSLKIAICLCLFLLVEGSTDWPSNVIQVKTFDASFFKDLQNGVINAEKGAVVLQSNLPTEVQAQIALALTGIYQSTSDSLERAQQFQATLNRMYSLYWNIVIDFEVITFYSRYYILLQIDNDRVLGFGLL